MGHESPAKILRNVKRMTYFLQRRSIPASSSPSNPALVISRPVHIDLPPDSLTSDTKQELLLQIENHQNVLIQVKEAYTEMLKVKDEHITFLKTELANLPAIVMSNLKAQLKPPDRGCMFLGFHSFIFEGFSPQEKYCTIVFVS